MKNKVEPGGDKSSDLMLKVAFVFVFVMAVNKLWPHLCRHGWLFTSITVMSVASYAAWKWIPTWNQKVEDEKYEDVAKPDEKAKSVTLGRDLETGRLVGLHEKFRTMHMQVIGTTNAGKSESTTLPLAVSDIQNKNGVFILDGKSDGRFVDKLYAYVKKYKREKDFKLFSLAFPEKSFSFNPLKGDSPQQITDRIFTAFAIENEYYRSIQKKYFLGIMRLVFEQNEVATFSLVRRLLTDMPELKKWIDGSKDESLKREMNAFHDLSPKDREERISGIEALLTQFTSSEIAQLFEETSDQITFEEAMEKNHILYFQLPTMYYAELGQATGKLILQCFQTAIAKRQLKMRGGDGTEGSDIFFLHP